MIEGESIIDLLMTWVAPVVGGAICLTIAVRFDLPVWAAMLCGFAGMFAGQLALGGLLALLSAAARGPRRNE